MIPDIVIVAIVTAVATSFIQPLVQAWLARRKSQAEVIKTGAEAHKVEAESVNVAAETTNSIVESSGQVIEQWRGAYKEVKDQMKEQSELSRAQIAALSIRVDYLTQKVERVLRAFRYLSDEVEADYPEAVKIARQIAAIDNDDELIPKPGSESKSTQGD